MARARLFDSEFYSFAPDYRTPLAVYRIDDPAGTRDVYVYDPDAGEYQKTTPEIDHTVRFAIYGNGELAYSRITEAAAELANHEIAARKKEIDSALAS